MADRYWVGGTADWDGTAGTKWSATSGGAGGASVPTTADDVFFDANSSGSVTIAAGNAGAKSINCTGFGGTLTGTGTLTVSGSITLVAGMTYTHTGTVTITGTGTLTTAGKTFSGVTINGSGITVTLGDALNTSTRTLTVTQGTFDTANYNVTCSTFSSNNSNTRTITMGSGLWTLSGTGTVWTTLTSTNLTFNKNTANILLSNVSTTARSFIGGALTYNKLTIGGTTGTSTTTLGAGPTFSEIASTKTVAHTVRLNGTLTIETWSITGTSGNVVTVNSTASGTRRDFNLTNVTSGIDYLAVQDIGVNQANRFYVGANSTDGGNNSNVIFTAAPSVTQTLTPSLFTNTNTFYTATVTAGAVTLTPALFTNTNVFYSATVSAGAITLTPALFNNTNAFYSATVTPVAITLTPSRYDNTSVFYSASVVQPGGTQFLTAELFTNANTFFSPTVTNGSIQPAQPSGSLVRPRKKFRPVVLFDLPEEEVVLPDLSAKTRLAGLSATLTLGSIVATSPDPINARTSLAFTQIETYMRGVTAQSSWNDPSDDELLFILDFALS